jgi:hypothetical protein
MAPMNRSLGFLLLALSAIPASRADAETVTLVTLDSTDLELVERSARKTSFEVVIPARFSTAGVKLRRWSISQDGRLIDRNGTTIALRTPADGTPELYASFDLSKLNASGHYLATIEFVAPKQQAARPDLVTKAPAAATGQPATAVPAEAAELEQTVQLKLNKPAAELRISAPLRFERTVYLPSWCLCLWSLEPGTITITEGTGKSSVKIDPVLWNVVLRHGDDAPEQRLLRVRMPDSIDGWGQGQAKIELEGPVAIGTTTGTLTIRAPQLAAHTVDFAVTLVSRVTALWLLPVILIGIGLGWYFRNVLDARRARLAAIFPAEQELATLDDLINAARDQTYRNSLERIRSTLVGKIEDQAGTPETIVAATAKAATDREAATKAMSDLRDRLNASLQAWSRPASVREPLPDDAAPVLAELRDLVGSLKKSFDEGTLKEVDDQMTGSLPEVARELRAALSEWLRQFNDLKITPPAPWLNLPLATKLSGVTVEADRLSQALGAAESPEALWSALISAATLLGHFKQDLFGTVDDWAAETASLASTTLRKFGAEREPQAAAIEAAVAALPDASIAGGLTAVEAFSKGLNALHAAIVDGLSTAWDDADHPLQGLEQGDFSLSLAALENKLKQEKEEKDLGEETSLTPTRTAAEFTAAVARVPEHANMVAVPTWKVILEAGAATVSEAVNVRARLIVPQGGDQPDVTLTWSKAGVSVGRSAPGTFERSFSFSEPGPVSIGVVAVDSAGASDSATLILQVRAVHGARAIASVQETLAKVERIQNIGAGAIITVAGWLIFSPTFTGTFPELFAAFLWGFSADVGTAKVRELAESLKGLKPPIPLPKQS